MPRQTNKHLKPNHPMLLHSVQLLEVERINMRLVGSLGTSMLLPGPSLQKFNFTVSWLCWFCQPLPSRAETAAFSFIPWFPHEMDWPSAKAMKISNKENINKNSLRSMKASEDKTKIWFLLKKSFVKCIKSLSEKQIECKIFFNSNVEVFEGKIQYIHLRGTQSRKI